MKTPFVAVLSAVAVASCSSNQAWRQDPNGESTRFVKERPIVIGHRGAPGHLPEHTLEGYTLAIEMGADFIEPDLVSTKDGVLIARHENEISETTDVAEKFPDRKKKKTIDGKDIEGWFTEDFTLKEIKTLHARERLPFRNHSNDGKFLVPTFEEVLQLAQAKSKETGRVIGVYPETKHPSYHRSIGRPLEGELVRLLKKYKLTRRDSPVFVQSFEVSNLKSLRKMIDVKLVQLLDEPKLQPADFVIKGDKRTYGDLATPAGLKSIKAYADGVGPWKRMIVGEDEQKRLLPANSFIADAHAAGLLVHPYTFRSDGSYLNAAYRGDPANEYLHFFSLGVDGLFSDFPDDAVKVRNGN